jgi:hypothetical protein
MKTYPHTVNIHEVNNVQIMKGFEGVEKIPGKTIQGIKRLADHPGLHWE